MTKEEAIKKIKSWDFLDNDEKEILETLIPELKESEDERIRKGIIKFLIDVNNGAYTKSELEIASWIAWLEKQGKQKAILDELEMTLSVSDDAYLRNNLEKLIKELKKEGQQ